MPVLSKTDLNRTVYVKSVGAEDALARRLEDLGITPGCPVTPLFSAPCGDPTAYLIRGALIAMRRRDTDKIEVQE